MDYLSIYSKYLQSELQKKGKKYFALCPFHSESNPSFSINPETGLFYCFGCEKKGNIFQFIQMMKEQGVEIDVENEKLIQRKLEIQKETKNKAKHNTDLGVNYRKLQQKTYEQKKNELLQQGYSFTAEYIYFDTKGIEQYRVYRFERPKGDGTFEKEIGSIIRIVSINGLFR